MSSPNVSLLAGLVKGYTDSQAEEAHEALAARAMSRDSMMGYLQHLATNPGVPSEHQQWALGKLSELAQADVTKKLPKVDLGELPPVSLKTPGATQQRTLPGGTLQAPQRVGQQAGGDVNALGAAPQTGPGPQSVEQQGPAPIAPASLHMPVQVPPQNVSVQAPDETRQISQGGLHILTAPERMAYAQAAETEQLNNLHQQFPEKTTEELAHYLRVGEFPEPKATEVPAGGTLVDPRTGRVIYKSTETKPGQKSGYEVKSGPGGEAVGVIDHDRNKEISLADAQNIPAAKKALDEYNTAVDTRERKAEEKEKRVEAFKINQQARAFANQETARVEGVANDAAKKAKPMVDVLDASEAYMKKGEFTPRQDLALVIRAVRAMNPGTVRLPQKELDLELKAGSYGDRFKRWYTTATEGLLPDDQRNDLMNVIREETTTTATSAAQSWRDAYCGRKSAPSYLKRFGGGQQLQAPTGGDEIPPEAAKLLQEGHETTFGNGQVWTLQNGKPRKVR